jgi:hypothetical protein
VGPYASEPGDIVRHGDDEDHCGAPPPSSLPSTATRPAPGPTFLPLTPSSDSTPPPRKRRRRRGGTTRGMGRDHGPSAGSQRSRHSIPRCALAIPPHHRCDWPAAIAAHDPYACVLALSLTLHGVDRMGTAGALRSALQASSVGTLEAMANMSGACRAHLDDLATAVEEAFARFRSTTPAPARTRPEDFPARMDAILHLIRS